jgi:hypothetical protein
MRRSGTVANTICTELHEQFIAFLNCKSPWSTKAFVLTVQEIEHHDDVSSGIWADEFRDKPLREWMKQALKTLEEAMESDRVEVILESHCRSGN